MTDVPQLCILVTLHPGGMTSEQYFADAAIDVTDTGWMIGGFGSTETCWHIVKSEIAEAVRLELEYLREEDE